MVKIESYAQGTPSYVELVTPDQAAAKEFYGPLFGWELEDVPLGDAGYYVAVSKEGDSVAGISGQMPGMEGHPAFWGVYLTVDDVDATAAKVEAAGGTVEAQPFDVMDLGRMAAIQDPTGARVNLWQAKGTIGTTRANEPGTPTWHELTTPDLPTATTFYSDVLGVEWETVPMGDAGDYLCLVADGRRVAGAVPPAQEGLPPHWDVCFDVESVEDTLARATDLGGRALAPPFDVEGVGRIAVLSDPQGAMFSVMVGS